MSSNQIGILELPLELLYKILFNLAKTDYYSINNLAETCHYLKDKCDEFTRKHPPKDFWFSVGRTNSSDEDEDDDFLFNPDDDASYYSDDLENIGVDVDRLSFGSNYDEAYDEFVYGPGGQLANKQAKDGDADTDGRAWSN